MDNPAICHYYFTMPQAIDLVLKEEVQELIDPFASLLGISIGFFAVNGEPLRRGLGRANSGYCQLIQDRLFGREPCVQMDRTMCGRCSAGCGAIRYRCHAGLEEAAAAIEVDGQLAGYMMIGQFRVHDTLPASVRRRARAMDCEAEIEAAFEALPRFTPEQADHLVGLFNVLIDRLIRGQSIRLRGDRVIGRALAHMEEHFAGPLGIQQVADAMGVSVSTLAHGIKRATGQTFVRHLQEIRLRHAETLMREAPAMSLQEIARACGFQDPYYFSRVFRKHRGIPPSLYRKER